MKKQIALPGSNRRPLAGAKVIGAVDPDQRIEITIQLRRRPGSDLDATVNKIASQGLADRKYLTRAELATQAGADPADMTKIEWFAHNHGLTVTEADAARRTMKLSGRVADLSTAFGVKLKRYKAGAISYRGRTGSLTIPAELEGIIERVLGLDDRPAVKAHYRFLRGAQSSPAGRFIRRERKGGRQEGAAAKSVSTTFTPVQLASIYDFPSGLDGTGQTVALIELNDVDSQGNATGAGYEVSDLQTFFKSLGIPMPSVSAVGVDGGANVPGKDANADGEVTLDIEVAAGIAPGAKFAVYFGTNTDDGFIQVVSAAVHDNVRKPGIVSISWGQAEETATPQMLQGLQQILQEAAALGVTVSVAAGDDGSADMVKKVWDKKPHVDFPASSPFALACGGTTLDAKSGPGAPVETVWNRGVNGGATGGGVSNFFPKPSYQANVKVPAPANSAGGRGVPDVSADADPFTGYSVVIGGTQQGIGGTSAVAPLYAGLIARINQSLTSKGGNSVGFINPLLYAQSTSAGVFHDVTSGNNDIYKDLGGEFQAGPGWDACTGLGSIDGSKLLAALQEKSAAPPSPGPSAKKANA
ncbi:MAG TPA: S53 family peptidase [Candidatus Acidoferrum sp.]|nr:S53 family peptidase [Candidatus Acidoferrum sp.]